MPLLRLLWKKDVSWGKQVRSLASNYDADSTRVYIEAFDSDSNCEAVMGSINSTHRDPVPWTAECLLWLRDFLRLDLENEKVFAHYDVVWFLDKSVGRVSPPPFMTWPGAEGEDSLPIKKEDPFGIATVSWQEVKTWMSSYRIHAGVASGQYILILELIDRFPGGLYV